MARPNTMPGADYRSLLLTIDKLYAAAVDPAKWGHFLGAAAALFNADNTMVCQAEARRRPFDYIAQSQSRRSRRRSGQSLRDGQGRAPAPVQRQQRTRGALPDGRVGARTARVSGLSQLPS